MNKRILILLILALSVLLFGCKQKPISDYDVALDTQFRIGVNQTVNIIGEPLMVKLIEINDGRCPVGAQCFAEDNIKAHLFIKKALLTRDMRIGYGLGTPKALSFEGYTFEFVQEDSNRPAEYVIIKVTKS